MRQVLSDLVGEECPEHMHHLPNILVPQVSAPLVSVCRSMPGHHLHNWGLDLAMWRKLRLPVYDPDDCPRCWCGVTHGMFGGHTFSCAQNNKRTASNFARNGWAVALQPPLSVTAYIDKAHCEARDGEGGPGDLRDRGQAARHLL